MNTILGIIVLLMLLGLWWIDRNNSASYIPIPRLQKYYFYRRWVVGDKNTKKGRL